MKLLLDQNISFRVAKKLRPQFPDCKHLSDCGLMEKEDPEIWSFAKKEGYTIVTFDADFYELSLINGHPPKIIWLRTGNIIRHDIIRLLKKKENVIRDFIESDKYKNISCLEIE